MLKETKIYSVRRAVTAGGSVYLSGVWYFDVPEMGRWYRDYTGSARVVSYPSYYPARTVYADVTVRAYSLGGTLQRLTLQVTAGSAQAIEDVDLLGGEVELTDTQPSGTLYNGLTDKLGLPSGSELAYSRTDTEVVTRLPLEINGVDFSEAASRLGYSIVYEDRVGASAVMMLNGDEYPDVLARRPVITWPLNMLWDAELARLHTALGDGNTYVPVRYFDTAEGKLKTGYFRGSIDAQTVGLNNARGLAFRDGAALTLRSR